MRYVRIQRTWKAVGWEKRRDGVFPNRHTTVVIMPLSGTPPTDAPGQPTSPTTRTRSHLTKSSITPGTPRTYGIPQNMQPPPSRHLQKAAPKVAQPVPAPPASAPPPTPPVDPAPPFTPSPNDKSAQLAGEKPTENTAAPETVPLPEVKKAKVRVSLRLTNVRYPLVWV